MAIQLQCDVCRKAIADLANIGTLNTEYQIGQRIVHVCTKCSAKVNKKLKKLSIYYGSQIASDMRQWLLAESSAEL